MSHAGAASSRSSASRPGRLLDTLYAREPALAAFGAGMALLLIPTLAAWALDTRLLNGVSVWVKPLKFQVSLLVHAWTVAWLIGALDPARRGSRLLRGLVMAMVATSLFEIAYIMLQAARGEASHFNIATPIARTMYQLMGVGAVVLVLATSAIGWMILRRPAPGLDGAWTMAVGLGLLLGGALGLITGMYVGGAPGHWVGGIADDSRGIAIFGWSTTGGDLRVAHFVGLHATQGLPVLGWIAQHLPAAARRPFVLAAAALWIAATAAVLAQAAAGIPFIAR